MGPIQVKCDNTEYWEGLKGPISVENMHFIDWKDSNELRGIVCNGIAFPCDN